MRILFLSNGHGEDAIGSRLAGKLLERTDERLQLSAFPLVGSGGAWASAGVPVTGPVRELPAGGLTFHSWSNFLGDVRSGLIGLTLAQLHTLRYRTESDAIVVIGDVWPLFLSLLPAVPRTRRFVLQTLVSVRLESGSMPRANRLLMERITWPERWLQKRFAARVWVRDSETAEALRRRGVSQAQSPGSFLFDAVPARRPASSPAEVLLLPGSRAWAASSLRLMLELASSRPELHFTVAWARPELPGVPGWQLQGSGAEFQLERGGVAVTLRRGAFTELLSRASAVVGTTGTAIEQAVASGLPALTFSIPGLHTGEFVDNQVRLLSGGLLRVDPAVPALSQALTRALSDPLLREAAAEAGSRVLGTPGGLDRIAEELLSLLSDDG